MKAYMCENCKEVSSSKYNMCECGGATYCETHPSNLKPNPMKTLTPENLAPYLPSDLIWGGDGYFHTMVGMSGNEIEVISQFGDYGRFDFYKNEIMKPLLYSNASLTKEITHKGETFTPIVELAKIAGLNMEMYEVSESRNAVIVKCGEGYRELNFDDENFGVVEYTKDVVYLCSCKVKNQLALFRKCWEWKIALDIHEELYIDVETLTENPYEK